MRSPMVIEQEDPPEIGSASVAQAATADAVSAGLSATAVASSAAPPGDVPMEPVDPSAQLL